VTSEPLTFSRLVALPENRLALAAIRGIASGHALPLFLFGPPGTGKTHMIWALVEQATRDRPDLLAAVLAASDLRDLMEAPEADLLVLEDLQHLPAAAVERVVRWFDARLAHRQQTVVTATCGPGELPLPVRLTSRLASGLVVGVQPYSAASRFALLQDRAERRQLTLSREVLTWLADHLGTGRQLDGALNQLEALARLRAIPLDVATVAAHFREQVEATRPTVERIAQWVGGHFQVDPRQLRSRSRQRNALVPRQVSMYLARQLTDLSLEEIGAYFGGRDHSTVLHACQKVEQALADDAILCGAVRRLHADLA
jgi:chromosomal replication initiator protein